MLIGFAIAVCALAQVEEIDGLMIQFVHYAICSLHLIRWLAGGGE